MNFFSSQFVLSLFLFSHLIKWESPQSVFDISVLLYRMKNLKSTSTFDAFSTHIFDHNFCLLFSLAFGLISFGIFVFAEFLQFRTF